MTTQILPRPLINQLLQHAQSRPEEEVCGLIASRGGEPMTFYPIANVAHAPRRLFAMDPAQQIAALRRMRERGEELFAIYHSHPQSPPVPSRIDIDHAAYPDALYVIASLATKGVLELRGYRLRDGEVSEVALEIAG